MIAAFDIDLHKIYGVREDGQVLCDGSPIMPTVCDFEHVQVDLVLLEIASPTSFGRGGTSSGVMFNLAKWAVFNVATIAAFVPRAQDYGLPVLVSPSDKWTMGYPLKVRHAMAKADAKNKDLRECQTMLRFRQMKPKLWVPFRDYLESL